MTEEIETPEVQEAQEVQEECESEFCEVTGEVEDTTKVQYTSRLDKDLDLEIKYKKEQISDELLENGFIIYARWSEASLKLKDEFPESKYQFVDIENYMEDLQDRNIKKVPAIILKDKVINGYEDAKDYLTNNKG